MTFQGPFDIETLESVQPSALVPFVRTGVRQLLRGLAHKGKWKEKAAIDRLPETQLRYRQAFDLVLQAIRHSKLKKRPGRLPNLQLFDLLAAIALNSESKDLFRQTGQILAMLVS